MLIAKLHAYESDMKWLNFMHSCMNNKKWELR